MCPAGHTYLEVKVLYRPNPHSLSLFTVVSEKRFTLVRILTGGMDDIALGEGLIVPEAGIAACVNGECVSGVPGSKSIVSNRIVCTGTWEGHIVPKLEASNEPKRRRRKSRCIGMAIGLTRIRGVSAANLTYRPCFLYCRRTYLVFRYLRCWVQGVDG